MAKAFAGEESVAEERAEERAIKAAGGNVKKAMHKTRHRIVRRRKRR